MDISESDLRLLESADIDELLDGLKNHRKLTNAEWAEIEKESDKIGEKNRRLMDSLSMSHERLHKQFTL